MKAIRVREFGSPEVLRLEDVPDIQPGPNQVVVRVMAAGVNPVETLVRSGAYARKPALPYTPGADAAGLIEAVGEGVSAVSPGSRVYTSGTITGSYAQQALCLESQVHLLPAQMSFAQGAAIGIPYATAYRALFHRAQAKPGEVVLVHGATGGVGVAAMQLARAAGLRVIGSGGSEKGLSLILAQGAVHALDHRAPDHLDRLRELTGGHGADIILEMKAHINLGFDLGALAMGGRVVIIGSRGKVEVEPREAMNHDAAILGMTLFNASAEDLAGIHSSLAAGLENGTLRPVIGREIPLSEAPRAHEAIMEPGAHGKIVLIP